MREERLHEMDPTGRFTDRAVDYAKHRPSYPARAVDLVMRGLGSQPLVADIGAGTGIFARLVGERGARVIGIEPNAAMLGAADRHDGVEYRLGRAEATGMPPSSVDAVTCAQSFHWFDAEAALVEFQRILRPHGRLALVWNDRDPSDPVASAYREAIRAVGGVHPSEARAFDPSVVSAGGLFSPPALHELGHEQLLSEEGFIGRAMSASYAPNTGESAQELKRRLRDAHRRLKDEEGLVRMRYITRVYTAESVPGSA